MKTKQIPNLLLLSALVGLISFSSGCQSGFTKPDLNRLAFWKKDDIRLAARRADDLAPPSSHFDPEPTDGGSSTRSSGSSTRVAASSATQTRDELQARVDNILAKANKKKAADSLKKPFDKPGEAIGKVNKQLFGANGKRSDVSQQAVNDIQAKLDALKKAAMENKVADSAATAATAVAAASETANDFAASDFQAPINNMAAKAQQTIDAGMASADSLKTKSIAGWNNDFSAMASNTSPTPNTTAPPTAANLAQSASNGLITLKNKVAEAGKAMVQATDDNSFEIAAPTKNRLANLGSKTAGAAQNVFAATKNMASKATESAGQLTSSAQQNLKSMTQNAFQPATPAPTGNNLLQPMRNKLNSMAQKTASTFNSTVNNIPSTAQAITNNAGQKMTEAQQAVTKMAQYESPNITLPNTQPPSTTATIHYNGGSGTTSQYPSTPYGQFKSNGTNDYSMNTQPGVIQAGGNSSLNSQVQQTSAENEIPAELLNGFNSFAPGSIKQVTPAK